MSKTPMTPLTREALLALTPLGDRRSLHRSSLAALGRRGYAHLVWRDSIAAYRFERTPEGDKAAAELETKEQQQ